MIYLGSDHRGFSLKEKLKIWLKNWGFKFKDLGAHKYQKRDDFADFAVPVAEAVSKKRGSAGILICGTGTGMDIVANKVKGVRSVLAINPEHARHSKKADHTNVLSLAADYLSEAEAKKIVRFFLETEFSQEDKYLKRVEKINQLEKKID